jgi:hypothetical protein
MLREHFGEAVSKADRMQRQKTPAPYALRLLRQVRRRMLDRITPGREIVHFLHIGKNAGSQLSYLFPRINKQDKVGIRLRKEGHKVTLAMLPPDARYFISIRDPISRFRSGFYSRKRKGKPLYDVEWTADEALAFENFEHANELAEALFLDTERGVAATAAMRSISHLAMNQVDWFPQRGFLFRNRPPVWILRTESFESDLRILLDRLGIDAEVETTRDEVSSHRNDYSNVPPLSELAVENLKRWYAQDFAFCAMCRDWLNRETAQLHAIPAPSRRNVNKD